MGRKKLNKKLCGRAWGGRWRGIMAFKKQMNIPGNREKRPCTCLELYACSENG